MIKLKIYTTSLREESSVTVAQPCLFTEFTILARLNDAGHLDVVKVK